MILPNNVSPIVKVYYGKPILPEVSRVLACLYEKDFKLVGFEDVDSMPIDLIRLQASTSVPAPFFEDGSKFLFESRAICRYVSETYANRGNRYLLGHDLLDRVSIEQWLKSEEQSFDPPSRALVLQLAFPLSTKSSSDLREESERLAKVLDVYNHRLGESRYLAGDEFTLADLTHLPNSQYLATSHEWGHLFDERENLNRWWEDVSTRPSWSQVVEELERSEEEGYQEEITEEETDYFEITRAPSKMSLKASIFLPIEESEPVKPKSTFKISKNVAGPRGSVSVTIPDKRGFSVSVPNLQRAQFETNRVQSHSTTHGKQTDAEVTMEESIIPPTRTQIPSTARTDKASTETTRVESQSTKQDTHDKVTTEGPTNPPTRTQIPSTARTDKVSTETTRIKSQSTKQETRDKVTTEGPPIPTTRTQIPPTALTDKAITETRRVESQSTKQEARDKVTTEGPTIPPIRTQIPPTARTDEASTEITRVESQSTKQETHDKVTTEGPTIPPIRTQIPPTAHTDKASTETTRVESQSTKQEIHDKVTAQGPTIPPPRTQIPSTARTDKASTETKRVKSQSTKQETHDIVTAEGPTIPPTRTQIPSTARTDKASTETTRVESQSTKQETHDKVTTEGPTIPPTRTQVPSTAHTDKAITETTRVESQSIKPVTDAKVKVEKTFFPPTGKEVPPTHETTTDSPKAIEKDAASLTDETSMSKSRGLLFRQVSPPTSKTVQPESRSPEGTQAPSTEKTTIEPLSKYQGQTSAIDSKQGHAGEKLTSERDETEIKADAFVAGKHKDWHEQYHQPEKFGEEKLDDGTLAQKPKPPIIEEITTTPSPTTTTSSETPRQEPVTSKSTDLTAKEPSESRTTTKPKDTTPPATQSTTIPAAPQDSTLGKTSGTSPTPTDNPQASLSSSVDESQGGISDKTNNVQAPKPSKQDGTTPPTSGQTLVNDERSAGIKDISQLRKAPAEEASRGTSNDLAQKSQAAIQMTPRVEEAAPKPQVTPDTEKTSPVNTTGAEKTKETKNETKMETKSEAEQLGTGEPKKTTLQPNKTNDSEKQRSVDETRTENRSELFQDEKSSSLKETTPTSDGSSTARDTTQKKEAQNETKMETKTESEQLGTTEPNRTTLQPNKTNNIAKRRSVDETWTKIGGELSENKASSSLKETTPTSDGRSKVRDTTPQQKETKNETKLETKTEAEQLGTGEPKQTTLQPNKTNDTEKQRSVDETGTENRSELSQDEKSSSLKETATSHGSSTTRDTTTKKKETQNETKMETNTESTQLATGEPNQTTLQQNKTNNTEKRRSVDETGTKIGSELSENKASSSLKKTAPTSDGSSKVQDTTSQQKETKNETKMETKTEAEQLNTGEPEQTSLQPNKTEKQRSVDETSTENRSELSQDEKSSSLKETTPTSDGSSSARDTTPQKKVTQNETKMETKTEAEQLGTDETNQTTLQPNKTNDAEKQRSVDETGTQNRSELFQDEKSSSLKETAPTSDGSSTARDTTQKKEAQNETKMETKTESEQLGTTETNQNKASSQDQEAIASNESPSNPPTEKNSEPNSTKNP